MPQQEGRTDDTAQVLVSWLGKMLDKGRQNVAKASGPTLT